MRFWGKRSKDFRIKEKSETTTSKTEEDKLRIVHPKQTVFEEFFQEEVCWLKEIFKPHIKSERERERERIEEEEDKEEDESATAEELFSYTSFLSFLYSFFGVVERL